MDSYEVAAHNYTHEKRGTGYKERWRRESMKRQKVWAANRATAAQGRRYAGMDAYYSALFARDAAAAEEEANKEAWADRFEAVQSVAAVVGVAAGVALLCTPVGWAATLGMVAFGAAAVGLSAGAARASLGDDEYGWDRFAVEATVTFCTAGAGGGALDDLSIGAVRASGAAWTALDAALLITE